MDEKYFYEANGLKLVSLKSKAEPLGNIDQQKLYAVLSANISNQAFVVAWLDHKVLIGLWQEKDFMFYNGEKLDLKYVQRLRVFNSYKELHLWRTNGALKSRLRVDEEGENAEAVVAHQLLFGTRGEELSSRYVRIEEERGTKLMLPLANVEFDDAGMLKERIFIKTHNYVRYNAIHQATYFDCRFVAFTNRHNELS